MNYSSTVCNSITKKPFVERILCNLSSAVAGFLGFFTIELMPSIFQFTEPCVNAVIEVSAIVPSRNSWSLFPCQGSTEL
jgi:hypothetical protein